MHDHEIYWDGSRTNHFYDTDDASGVKREILRCKEFMGDDELGNQLRTEAREIYFGENTFRVQYPCFSDFMTRGDLDYLNGDGMGNIVKMLKKVTMEVFADYTFVDEEEDINDADYHPEERGEFSALMCLENVKLITIEILGEGLLDGSDAKTQTTLLGMSSSIRMVVEHFAPQVAVVRCHTPTGRKMDITNYFDRPCPEVIQLVQQGVAPFAALMQVQIDDLLHEWED